MTRIRTHFAGETRARLPVSPAALSLLTIAILGWLAWQSASTLLLWRSQAQVTSQLESALEDLTTVQSTFQETTYSAIAYHHTASPAYLERYNRQKQLLLASLERASSDLGSDPAQKELLEQCRQDLQPLFASMDGVIASTQRSMQAGSDGAQQAPGADMYGASETLSVRVPREALMARLDALDTQVRNRFYARRALAAKALQDALRTLFWSAAGALALAGLVLLALVWVARRHEEAEEGLASTEEQYRDLLEHSRELIAVLSADGKYVYANPAWRERLGEAPSSPDAELLAQLGQRALAGEHLEELPLRLTRKDGAPLLVRASLSRRQLAGEPDSVRWVCHDVTERDARERRLRAQIVVAEILGSAQSVEEALPLTLEQLARAVSADYADIWTADEAQQKLQPSNEWARQPEFADRLRPRADVLKPGELLPGCVLKTRQGCWRGAGKDQPIFPGPDRSSVGPQQISAIGVPVPFGGRVLATMQFYFVTPMARQDELLAMLETVGASIGQFVARCGREWQLEALHRQTDSILDSVADGIIGVDADGRALFVNPAAASLLEEKPELLQNEDVHWLLHGSAQPENACNGSCVVRRMLQSREGGSGQSVIYRRDGSSYPMEFSVSPLNHDGAIVGSVLTVRDITERHALDRMKDEFVSTVSHELRTPLTSIRGALGLLDSGRIGSMNDEASRMLRIAVTNTDRLIRLINDILDLERMESGRATLQLRTLDLAEMLQQSVETMRPMADSAGIRIELVTEPAQVEADADRMQQVFTNLLSNAIKFSPPDSTVRVTLEAGESNIALSVSDEGRGIPVDKLETIFQRFQQVDATDSRQKGGTGLGLAICRSIVQQHGGRIWAERNAVRGVSMRMLLPCVQASTAPELGLFAVAPPSPRETILICEDDRSTREIVRRYLEQQNYCVLESASGEEALTIAREQRPDAILLDMNLPGISGWEVVTALKSDSLTAGIPVVVLSMLAPSLMLAGETDAWLRKPVDDKVLIRALGRVLRGMSTGDTNVLLVEDDVDLASVIAATFQSSGITLHHARTLAEARHLCERVRPDLMVLDLGLPDGDGMELVDWLRQQYELHRLPLVVYSGRDVTANEQGRLYEHPTQILSKQHVMPEEIERLVLAMLRTPAAHAESALHSPWDVRASNF